MQLPARTLPSVILIVALLGGCTEPGPEPRSSLASNAPSDPAPTPSPSPTADLELAVAPEPPPALDRGDEVGAAAAAEYFVALYPYTLSSGDVTAWEQMSHEACKFCMGIRDDAVAAEQNGERYEGGQITLSDLVVHGRDELLGGYPVEARYVQEVEVHRGADGRVISTIDSNSGEVRIDAVIGSTGWKILAVVVDGS